MCVRLLLVFAVAILAVVAYIRRTHGSVLNHDVDTPSSAAASSTRNRRLVPRSEDPTLSTLPACLYVCSVDFFSAILVFKRDLLGPWIQRRLKRAKPRCGVNRPCWDLERSARGAPLWFLEPRGGKSMQGERALEKCEGSARIESRHKKQLARRRSVHREHAFSTVWNFC